MNRTGFKIALAVAFVTGLLCAVDPQLDLDLAGLAFSPKTHMFDVNAQLWVQYTREAARLLITLLVLPAFLAVLGKLILPQRRMLIEGRAALFLIATLALGPGALTNLILKDHWGRARPIDVQQFGGDERFTPWWDWRGDCPNNCSFIAGEPSGAFWTLAPAALAPPELLPLAYGAALAFGIGTGALRMAAGAHFFSDVVFAGVLMYLLVWVGHGLIYRWPATRMSEAAIEAFLVRAGEGLRDGFSALAARVRQFTDRSGKGL
jgi:lipid A 4'-phosphatase